MISKTFNRYVWLLNTLIRHKSLTFEEIALLWSDSGLDNGKELALRTFHVHRKAIAELFGVEIKCDSSYKYYISSPRHLLDNKINKWLLNSFAISNMIEAGRNMKDRVILENTTYGTEYLQTVMDAMQRFKELQIDYQAFNGPHKVFNFQPYAMKVFQQRWYVVGYLTQDNAIRNIALDRVIDMEVTDISFSLPKDFDAKRYFANYVGIFVNENLTPQTVIIRIYGNTVEYLRKQPFHPSQEEILCRHGKYSEFKYMVCLTPELTTRLLSLGDNVEVIQPEELRIEIQNRLAYALKRYKK